MKDFLKEIKNDVVKLSRTKRTLFSVVNCEKLLPNYVAFQEHNGWGNYHELQESIDITYQYLINSSLFKDDDFFELLERMDNVTPHTEEFSGILTSFALDACTAIESTLRYILSDDVEYVMEVVTYAYDTVDMFIQEKDNLDPNDKEIDERIRNDVFMQREKARQKELILRLSKLKNDMITDDIIKSLKNREKIIDIELLK
jgi:uncharacterized protein YjaG (DUF416 family)